MRKVVVSVLTSVDGYYTGPDRDLSGMPFEDAFNDHNLALLREAGTLVYGTRWFRENWEHWSAVGTDPGSGERDREVARIVTTRDVLVIGDSASIASDDPWASSARAVRRADAPDEIARLREGDGGTLLLFGSAPVWNPLLARGLVDELVVLVGAGLMGQGARLYEGPHAGLRLLDAAVLPGSQLVRLRYDATGAGGRE